MLEKIDLSKKVDKKTYRRVMDEAEGSWGFCRGSVRMQAFRSFWCLREWEPPAREYRLTGSYRGAEALKPLSSLNLSNTWFCPVLRSVTYC